MYNKVLALPNTVEFCELIGRNTADYTHFHNERARMKGPGWKGQDDCLAMHDMGNGIREEILRATRTNVQHFDKIQCHDDYNAISSII